MVKLRDVARPLKSRRDATKTEAAADGAARQFERCRKDLAAKKEHKHVQNPGEPLSDVNPQSIILNHLWRRWSRRAASS